ncbi:MAG: hypothetical protein V2A65_06370 [Candidatus Omnitrophota bacterium]
MAAGVLVELTTYEFETMQLAVAIALTVIYLGLSLTLGGVHPKSGMPWWFFVPAAVAFCASYVAERVAATLPMPWVKGPRYGSPPRRVHLSWRTAVRIPALAPVFVIPFNFFLILRIHFAIGWVVYIVVPLAAVALAIAVRRRRREVRLLRGGETAMGVVDWHENIGEGPERITYHFMTADGTTVSGRGWDAGYGLLEGSSVPVFYDANNLRDHVVVCGCWFEAD